MQARLTKRLIADLRASGRKRIYVWDTEVVGLGLVARPSGAKTFVLFHGTRNTRRLHTLGRYGVLTLEDARAKATRWLARLLEGHDPTEDRKRRQKMPSFREWTEEFLKHVDAHAKKPAESHYYLGKAVADFGKKPLDQVSVQDIESAAAKIVAAGRRGPNHAGANRFMACVSAALKYAWMRNLIQENPVRKIRRYAEPPPRQRVLSDAEFARVLEAVRAIGDPFVRTSFVLLLTTGARKSEVLQMKWEDIDFHRAIWHLPRTKSGRPQDIPLPAETLQMLQHLPRPSGRSSVMFPGRDPSRSRKDLKYHWNWIRKNANVMDVTVHDIRRTFGRDLTQQAGLLVASRALRHSDIRIAERHYAPLGIEEVRKQVERRTRRKIVPIARSR